jgi:hypothetical protein
LIVASTVARFAPSKEHAAYEYVKQRGERVHALHVAMNAMVKPDADFFLETQIG